MGVLWVEDDVLRWRPTLRVFSLNSTTHSRNSTSPHLLNSSKLGNKTAQRGARGSARDKMAELLELVFGCNLCSGLEALGGKGFAMAVAKLVDLIIDWVIVEKVLKCKACGRSDASVNFEGAVEVEQEGYPIHLIVMAIVIAVCGTLVELGYALWRKLQGRSLDVKELQAQNEGDLLDTMAKWKFARFFLDDLPSIVLGALLIAHDIKLVDQDKLGDAFDRDNLDEQAYAFKLNETRKEVYNEVGEIGTDIWLIVVSILYSFLSCSSVPNRSRIDPE